MESQSSATVREGSNHSGDYIREESDRVVSTGGYMVGMDPRVPPLQHTVRHFMPHEFYNLLGLDRLTVTDKLYQQAGLIRATLEIF